MEVVYNEKTDLLYIRMDSKKQKTINQRINENIVLDIGSKGKIIGIEILDASENINLSELFPVNKVTKSA